MNIGYFIEKFAAIPDEKWIVNRIVDEKGRCCVLGHCGLRYDGGFHKFHHTPESNALIKLFLFKKINIAFVNNGTDPAFAQATPKARVLAALEYLEESGCE